MKYKILESILILQVCIFINKSPVFFYIMKIKLKLHFRNVLIKQGSAFKNQCGKTIVRNTKILTENITIYNKYIKQFI